MNHIEQQSAKRLIFGIDLGGMSPIDFSEKIFFAFQEVSILKYF